MSESLNETEQAAIEMIRRYAAEVLAPAARQVDESGEFVSAQLEGLAQLGVLGMNLPEQWGGAGLSPIALLAAIEAIAAGCGSTASALTAHFLATDAILLGGDDDLRARFLPAAATGEALGAFGLTEPQAGSNPSDMRCRAERAGDRYRIRGTKHFISNGGVADFIVVFAITDPEAGHRGISAFVVEREAARVGVAPPERTMGLHGGHVFELSFDCEVPAENRLGAEGAGFRTAMRTLDNGRVDVAAMAIGMAQAALDAAGKRARGERFTQAASMAKLHASEMATRVIDAALQLHGGYGYTTAFPLERWLRDSRIFRIYEGASEIQRTIIARTLLV